jgi:subtilisin family serine protease
VVSIAAGNHGGRSPREYPAAEGVYGAVAVGASNAARQLAAFSNHGSWVDLAAPGEAITSAVPGGWGTWSGTSMAAPVVAGTAALLRSMRPHWSSKLLARRLVCTGSKLDGSPLPEIDPLAAVHSALKGRGCS